MGLRGYPRVSGAGQIYYDHSCELHRSVSGSLGEYGASFLGAGNAFYDERMVVRFVRERFGAFASATWDCASGHQGSLVPSP